MPDSIARYTPSTARSQTVNVTVSTRFTQFFPEFSSFLSYPLNRIWFWEAIGALRFTADVWQDQQAYAIYLFVAHQLTLEYRNNIAGAAPGSQQGLISSQSASELSMSVDTVRITFEGKTAAYWNQTSYGVQLYQLIQLFGARPMQLGWEGGGSLFLDNYKLAL